ncbi:MAG: flagellin [Sulfitobacter sp.]
MSSLSIGDLSQTRMLQRHHTRLKSEMMRLTEEVATGQVSDMRQVLDGNYGYLTNISRALETLGGYKTATGEATLFAAGVQAALGRVETLSTELGGQLLVAANTRSDASGAEIVEEAYQALDGMISALNTRQAGRSLFSGTATNIAPLSTADELLTALKTAMAGATTPDDMLLAAQNWFDDPAGFTAVAYHGASTDLAPISVSDTETIDLSLRADDAVLRDALRNAAVVALSSDPSFALNSADQADLFQKSANLMLGGRDKVITERARIGFAEARIDTIAVRNAAEQNSLEQTRNTLMAIDPYEAATDLERIQFQLESLYAITARSSQLSLVNFL